MIENSETHISINSAIPIWSLYPDRCGINPKKGRWNSKRYYNIMRKPITSLYTTSCFTAKKWTTFNSTGFGFGELFQCINQSKMRIAFMT